MATGGFIGYAPKVYSTISLGAGTLWLTPLVAPRAGIATAVLLQSLSAQSGFNLKALIYDGSHSTLLATSSTVTSMAADYNRLPLTATLNLTAGTTYYVGYICDGTFVVGRETGTGPGSWYAPGSVSVASPPNPLASGSNNSITIMLGVELDGATAAGFGWGLDQSANITLSSSNTIATATSAANQGARSVITNTNGAGKYYAEIVIGGTINSEVAVGVASVNWGVSQAFPGGQSAPGYVAFLYPSGGLSSASSLGALAYVSGDTIGIAYDAGAKLLWLNKNNGTWWGISAAAGNPVTGTNGWSFNTTTWPMALGAMTGGTGTAATFTLHDTAASLTYAPPAGYAAWSPYVAPALSTARVMMLA